VESHFDSDVQIAAQASKWLFSSGIDVASETWIGERVVLAHDRGLHVFRQLGVCFSVIVNREAVMCLRMSA
jgi:hypothetical protein